MRIAISGASGTGKTTLARQLAEHYQIPLNPIGSRSVAKEMGFDNPYEVDKAGKRVEFQSRLFEAKRVWEQAHESFVTDRSYLDNLTYCAMHMVEHVTDEFVVPFMEAMGRYDWVFVLKREDFQQLDDGIRQTNPLYHEIYEHLLERFFEKRAWELSGRATKVIWIRGDLREQTWSRLVRVTFAIDAWDREVARRNKP